MNEDAIRLLRKGLVFRTKEKPSNTYTYLRMMKMKYEIIKLADCYEVRVLSDPDKSFIRREKRIPCVASEQDTDAMLRKQLNFVPMTDEEMREKDAYTFRELLVIRDKFKYRRRKWLLKCSVTDEPVHLEMCLSLCDGSCRMFDVKPLIGSRGDDLGDLINDIILMQRCIGILYHDQEEGSHNVTEPEESDDTPEVDEPKKRRRRKGSS